MILKNEEQFKKIYNNWKNIKCVDTHWSIVNNILYKLCQDFPSHDKSENCVAKVLLIGRCYSAAIERRNNRIENNLLDFYVTAVKPLFENIGKQLDNKLKSISDSNDAIHIHGFLSKKFGEICEQNQKISLASKYLHFHNKKMFYIYDSRVEKAISWLVNAQRNYSELNDGDNKIYRKFYDKAEFLRKKIKEIDNRDLDTRELDSFLLYAFVEYKNRNLTQD